MKKYISFFVFVAAFFICAVMSSCGNKSEEEIPLDRDAYSENADGTGKGENSEEASAKGESQANIGDMAARADAQSVTESATEEGPIFVHICGAVKNPDVYEVKSSDRLIDVIKLAGGFTEEADSDYHNLAGGVVDGQKVYIPTEQEVADGLVPAPELNTISTFVPGAEMDSGTESVSETSVDDKDKVNINTASAEELKTLSGIGDKRAQDIIDYRTSNGNFKRIEDIKKVDGIKDGIFNKIKDYISI